MQSLRAGYSLGERSVRIDYNGEFHRDNKDSFFSLHAYGSGAEVLRFHGFGNETEKTQDNDFYRVEADQVLIYPTFSLPLGTRTSVTIGPALKYTRTQEGASELINEVKPYGVGNFGELAVHGVALFDGRDNAMFPRRGVFLAARGTWFPKTWDVKETFGETNATAAAYLSGGKRVTLALRGGGKKVFGKYPYFEAATIGSGSLGVGALEEPDFTVRGFRPRRFLGDSSLYGTAELRLRVSHLKLVLPGQVGLLGFVDSGRVWLEGEDSGTWHAGAGGGLWYSLLNDRSVLSVGIAHSKEDDLVYFKGGFTF
jgi:outer membrane protein assembly factor BamA